MTERIRPTHVAGCSRLRFEALRFILRHCRLEVGLIVASGSAPAQRLLRYISRYIRHFHMRQHIWAALPLLLLLTACPPRPDEGEPVDIARAGALARHDSVRTWPATDAGRPVFLYVDRSQSMRGFLDPEYPTRVRTDYRSVLDGFDARLRPAQQSLRQSPSPGSNRRACGPRSARRQPRACRAG